MRDEPTVGSRDAAIIAGVAYKTFMRWVNKGLIEPAHENPGLTGAKVFYLADIQKIADGERPVRKYTRREVAS